MTGALKSSPQGIPVALKNVRRVFAGGVTAVDGIDLHVAAGEFLAILGPSGCGKSTLLRLIAGLDQPDEGEVTIGAEQTMNREGIAYVFQDAHLLPWRNVLNNVALPLEFRSISSAERREIAADALAQVGLADAMKRYPNQLSGGMRMRVSLARALVTQPKLLLLDEPFAALDELTREGLDEQLHSLWRMNRMTTIFVTHSVAEATFLAERAIVLSPRPAQIVLDQTIELPRERSSELRTDPQFTQAMRPLHIALRNDLTPSPSGRGLG